MKYCCLGKNLVSGTFKFKIYLVAKSIPAAKFCQNFVDILGGQKVTWANLKSQYYIDITRTKINLGSHHLHT